MGALFPLSALRAPLPRKEQGRGNAKLVLGLCKIAISFFFSSPLLFGGEVSAKLTERGSEPALTNSHSRTPSWA
jgi:hypothetical protein